MEFLLRIEVTWPADGDPAEKGQRIKAEAARARELAEAGIIKRVWRIPGRWANWGLWEAPDATVIHQAVTSLPMWPFLDVEVIPLAAHPNDPGAAAVGPRGSATTSPEDPGATR
jgi:muconolactone D-isomerase